VTRKIDRELSRSLFNCVLVNWSRGSRTPGDFPQEGPGAERVTPEAALQVQVERYRKMTPEQRLWSALDLHALSCDVGRKGIRRQFPDATDEEVERHLRLRVELSHSRGRGVIWRCSGLA